jgi:glycerol-3-phosphate acyltransferase PlsY
VTSLLLAIIAFLCGSFPSGVVLSRVILHRDVREVGSGNIGAANAARAGGLRFGIAVGVLDILKGLIPVLLARLAGMDAIAVAVIALLAVFGHDFSIFLRFRGGKGVATSFGVALALAPPATALAAVAWVVVLAIWGYSSLASLVALAVLPALFALTHQPPAFLIAGVAMFLLGAGKHAGNIQRLLTGTESSFRKPQSNGS